MADIAIPDRLWSGFKPAGGALRTLRRAMTEDERRALMRRVAGLEPALLPYQRPDEDDRVVAAVDELLASYSSMRSADESLVARIKGAIDILADMPAWAIEQGCLSIRRYGYEVNDGERTRIEQNWPPSDAQIHATVAKAVSGRAAALASARALLAAPVEPTEAPLGGPPASVKAMLADFKSHGAAAHLVMVEAETRRQALRSAAARKRHDEMLRRDYRAAGLEPPELLLVSLPMMLKMGWTIVEARGERVLVAPPPEPPGKPRVTQPHEMGS